MIIEDKPTQINKLTEEYLSEMNQAYTKIQEEWKGFLTTTVKHIYRKADNIKRTTPKGFTSKNIATTEKYRIEYDGKLITTYAKDGVLKIKQDGLETNNNTYSIDTFTKISMKYIPTLKGNTISENLKDEKQSICKPAKEIAITNYVRIYPQGIINPKTILKTIWNQDHIKPGTRGKIISISTRTIEVKTTSGSYILMKEELSDDYKELNLSEILEVLFQTNKILLKRNEQLRKEMNATKEFIKQQR